MYALIVSALFVFALVAPAHAQVHVDIGIHLPAPPHWSSCLRSLR